LEYALRHPKIANFVIVIIQALVATLLVLVCMVFVLAESLVLETVLHVTLVMMVIFVTKDVSTQNAPLRVLAIVIALLKIHVIILSLNPT